MMDRLITHKKKSGEREGFNATVELNNKSEKGSIQVYFYFLFMFAILSVQYVFFKLY